MAPRGVGGWAASRLTEALSAAAAVSERVSSLVKTLMWGDKSSRLVLVEPWRLGMSAFDGWAFLFLRGSQQRRVGSLMCRQLNV